MPARTSLYQLLSNDAEIRALGAEAVYSSGGVDTPTEDCFIIIRWENQDEAFKRNGTAPVLVWIHDKQPNYDRIDEVERRVVALLRDAVHIHGSDGWTLTQAKVDETSGDLYDDGFTTCTRFVSATVSSRYNGH